MALVRLLARSESPLAIVFYMNLIMTPLSLGPALWWWEMPTMEQLGWLLGIGCVLTIAHFSMARALSIMEATAIVPLDFTRLPFAVLIGWFAFGEFPGVWTWVGAVFIVASAVYIARREALRAARPCAPPTRRRRPVTGANQRCRDRPRRRPGRKGLLCHPTRSQASWTALGRWAPRFAM